MICLKKTAILTLSLATTWSATALGQPGPQPPPEAYTACEGKKPGEKASFMTPQGNSIVGTCEQQGNGRLLLRPDNFGMGMGNGIPPAAYRNCMGKRLGDQVQVTIPNGQTISGTCQSDGERLYLRPDGPGPQGMGGMMMGAREQNPPRHAEREQYQEAATGNTQSDTWQQAPVQEEEDKSSAYQQQNPLPEDTHANVQQQEPPQTQGGNGRPNPPEAAYKACEGKSAGDKVQLTGPQGRTITGTCEQNGDRLFLRPNRPDSPAGGTSSENNMQQQEQQSSPDSSADQTAAQQAQQQVQQQVQQPVQQPVQHPVQKPQEKPKPKGFLDKVKDFWQKLW